MTRTRLAIVLWNVVLLLLSGCTHRHRDCEPLSAMTERELYVGYQGESLCGGR